MNNEFKKYSYDNIINYKNSYVQLSIKDILNNNIGKKVSIYESFNNSNEWKDKAFTGILEKIDNDYIILSDPTNNNWYLLLNKYVDYIKFEEEINFYTSNY